MHECTIPRELLCDLEKVVRSFRRRLHVLEQLGAGVGSHPNNLEESLAEGLFELRDDYDRVQLAAERLVYHGEEPPSSTLLAREEA